MRTTIDLDDALLAALKQQAAKTGRTMASLVEDAVRGMLARASSASKPHRRIKLGTFRGTGLLPGVDLWDSAALLDRMDDKK